MKNALLLFLFLVSSCIADFEAKKRAQARHDNFPIGEFSDQQQVQEIKKRLDRIESEQNFTEVLIKPNDQKIEKSGRRVLIVDRGMRISSATLYRDQVLAHYTYKNEVYSKINDSIAFYEGFLDLIGIFKEFPEQLTNPVFVERLKAMSQHFGKNLKDLGGHGDPTFNLIAELNPRVEFVLVDDDLRLHKDFLCKHKSLSRIELMKGWRDRASRLNKIIREYEIDIVNLSLGFSTIEVMEILDEVCPGHTLPWLEARKISETFSAFLKSLSGNVIVFQAGPVPLSPINAREQSDFQSDCSEIKMRIVVGFSTGSPDQVGGDMLDAKKCIEIYVHIPEEPKILYSVRGVGHYSLMLTPSWTTPIAISHFLYLTAGKPLSESFLDFKHRYRIVNPIPNAQFIRPQYHHKLLPTP